MMQAAAVINVIPEPAAALIAVLGLVPLLCRRTAA